MRGLVLGEQRQQHVEIGRHLGDHRAVDLGEEAGEQGGLAAAPAEQLDDADPLVAFDRGAQRVDRLDRAADRGREADAIIGAEHVIVHRLGHRDDRHALRGEMGGEAQRAVAAQRDHRVDAERVEHVAARAPVRSPSVVGARIAARGVEDGAAGPVDAAHALAGQRQAVRGDARRIGGVDPHHPFPAAPEAGHLPAEIVGRQHDRADAGVEPGHVAAAGEYSDPHGDRLSAAPAMDATTGQRAVDMAAGRRRGASCALAWPIMLTSLNWTLMHIIDVAVVGHYGTDELAALAASRTLTFIAIVMGFSGLSGVLVFASRADGGGRLAETGDIFRSGLVLGLAIGMALRSSCCALGLRAARAWSASSPACSGPARRWSRRWRSPSRPSSCSPPPPISSKGSAGRAG